MAVDEREGGVRTEGKPGCPLLLARGDPLGCGGWWQQVQRWRPRRTVPASRTGSRCGLPAHAVKRLAEYSQYPNR